jgi:dolichol kinase
VSEIERRLVHASGTGFPALYLLGLLTWRELGYLLVAATAVAGVLEFLRLYVGLDWSIYDRLTREYEQDNPAGYALYFVSMTAVAFLFEPAVAVPGMLMLTIGDPISGLLGSNDAGRAKRLGVLAAMFAVCFLLAVPFTTGALPSSAWLIGVVAAAVGAAGATLADGVKPVVATYVIDDNLSIPPTACVGMWVVLALAG